jgi:tetratricopeptide (TPR) repeat protein
MGLTGLPQVIRRSEREHDARHKKQRAQRNLALAELEMQQTRPSSRLWNCMGDALQTLGDYDRSVSCFRQSLPIAERGSSAMLEAYYGLLTSLGANPLFADEQLKLCMQALETFPVDAQLLCALGGYMQARGNLPLASKTYLTAFQFGQVNPIVWHVAEIRDIAAVCHSITLQLLDQTDAAVAFLESALREDPPSTRLRRRLMDVHIQKGDRDEALRQVGALPETTGHKEALRSAVRGACFAVQQNPVAAKAYLSAAYSHGCRDVVCLKWLALCLLSAGDVNGARPILDEWNQLEPRNPEIGKLLSAVNSQPTAAASATRRIDSADKPLAGPVAPIKLNLPAWK